MKDGRKHIGRYRFGFHCGGGWNLEKACKSREMIARDETYPKPGGGGPGGNPGMPGGMPGGRKPGGGPPGIPPGIPGGAPYGIGRPARAV